MQTSSLRRKYAADFEQDKRFAPIITRAPPIDRQLTKGVRNGRNPCKHRGFDQTVNFFAPLLTHRDDLGRVVIPKEIRRTMRIREGDPLEIFTEKDGEVIFKKYSPIGELGDFAVSYAESLNKTSGVPTLITDRDNIIAVSGIAKKELLEKRVSSDIENLMSERESFKSQGFDSGLAVAEGSDSYNAGVVVPIISEGDTIGSVIFVMKEETPTDTEVKLAEAAANFLGRHMEG